MGQQTSTIFRLSDVDPGQARITGADGGTPIGTSVTYGQDDYGADFKVFGDTSGTYMLWDESTNSFLIPGTTGKFQIGAFTGAASGTGSVVSASTTAPFKVFADDGGAAIGSGTLARAGWFRNLQTYTTGNREQESTGVQGSLVSVAGTNRHNMSGVMGTYEARTSLIVGGQSAATDTWCQAGVLGRVGMSTGTLLVDTNAVLAGVAAMSNVNSAVSETLTGAYTAFYAGAWASAIDWAYGMYLEGGKFTTGIAIGSCTDGITIGVCTDGITITGATGYALDIQTSGQIRVGTADVGVPTLTATPYGMEIHTETGAVAIAPIGGGTGITCGIRSRYHVSVAQTEIISFEAIDARLRVKANMAGGVHSGLTGTIESDGAITYTGAAQRSAGVFTVELGSTCVFTGATGSVCGVTIDSSIHATQTDIANVTLAGLRIKKSGGKLAWKYGIYMDAGGSTDGIYLSATTKAHEMVVTALPANARGARYAFTCATPAMSDGYGAHEIDLTIGAAATGSTSASSCWLNAGNAATIKNYGWVHNDGVWIGNSCTASNATIAYARVHFIFGTNVSYHALHLFDLNLDIDQNMTSLINCNNIALVGYTAGSHGSAVTGSIPFIGTGTTVKYIRVYDTAA